MVARELRSGTCVRLWRDELRARRLPPFSTGPDTLFVAYYASAELGCFLELGWPVPERVLDLFTEFRCLTNGRVVPCGSGLVGALAWYGLDGISAVEKDTMRQLIIGGGPWSESERRDILEYCETDVLALERLLPAMLPTLDLPRALLRGRFMAAAARMERTGVPLDTAMHGQLVERWADLKGSLVTELDASFGVFDGTTFKAERFAAYLARERIPWPRLDSGALDLADGTFRDMARAHPQLSPLRELRNALSQLRLNDLAIGSDGRNRVLLSAFRAKSGRNAPSNSRFIFGPSVWLRSLIQPPPGRTLAYVDWSQQEFGIAAALSGDGNMVAAYESGDPYLAFAKQAKAAPPEATKKSHGPVRELYKTCALGVQFGMGAESMAARIGQPTIKARDLLRDHKRTYRKFWDWSDAAADRFNLTGRLQTVFGWTLHNGSGDSDRTARNFPMQANGAEMMRVAACHLTEAGIRVAAPVHDAFLIEAPADELADVVAEAQRLMAKASADVLAGFELRSDVAAYRHPERFMDERGRRMFDTVSRLLATCPPADGTCSPADGTCSPADATCPPADSCFFYQKSYQ
jgi:hypothetical protein